jgi:hypothetical protein
LIKENLVAEQLGKIPENCRKFRNVRMGTWVNFGAQELRKGISRLQGISENANMLRHDMQPNALLAWRRFYDAKSGCYTLLQNC